MRQMFYTDGTPTREIEEDWEASGQEEMNELYLKIKEEQCQKSESKSVNIEL